MSVPIVSRRALLGAVAATAFAPRLAFASTADLGLNEIIRRHVAARGGAAALDRVRSCAIDVDIEEGGQTLQGRYKADVNGTVRIDVYVNGRWGGSEGVDREGVWLWPGNEAAARPSVATGAANALHHGAENHLIGLHRFAERGHRLRLMPAETIDGVAHPVIEVVYTTGHTSYFYVDPSSWMLARRRDQRAYHPDVDSTQRRVETRFSDFQAVDGVVAAHANTDIDLANGSVLSSNRVTRRSLNPQLADEQFQRGYRAPERLTA